MSIDVGLKFKTKCFPISLLENYSNLATRAGHVAITHVAIFVIDYLPSCVFSRILNMMRMQIELLMPEAYEVKLMVNLFWFLKFAVLFSQRQNTIRSFAVSNS